MKIRILLFLAIISIAFAACSLNGESNYTPQVYFVKQPYTQDGDSLYAYLKDDSYYHFDTISVGDTVTFWLFLDGITNNLTNFNLAVSDTSQARIILPSSTWLDPYFTSESNYKTGKLLFKADITNLILSFKYVAKKADTTPTLNIDLVSDAKFDDAIGLNYVSIKLKTPIIQKK